MLLRSGVLAVLLGGVALAPQWAAAQDEPEFAASASPDLATAREGVTVLLGIQNPPAAEATQTLTYEWALSSNREMAEVRGDGRLNDHSFRTPIYTAPSNMFGDERFVVTATVTATVGEVDAEGEPVVISSETASVSFGVSFWDITPDIFSFAATRNVAPNGTQTSEAIRVTGLAAGARAEVLAQEVVFLATGEIEVVGPGRVIINRNTVGPTMGASGEVLNGYNVAAIATVGACGTVRLIRVSIGGVANTYGNETSIFSASARACRSDATLSALTLSDVTLVPVFDSATHSYTASVGHEVARTFVETTPNDGNVADVRISVSGVVASVRKRSVALNVGVNEIGVTVIAEDTRSVLTYTVTVTRAAPETRLRSLSVTPVGPTSVTPQHATLTPAFAPDTRAYAATVEHAVGAVTVSAAPMMTGASVGITATEPATVSGNSVALGIGTNAITITVTAADGVTTDEYTLIVTRTSDEIPDAFTFLPRMNLEPNRSATSNAITVSGLSPGAPVPVSVTGGLVSINGGPPVASGTVRNGNTVAAVASVGRCTVAGDEAEVPTGAVLVEVTLGAPDISGLREGVTGEFAATVRACRSDTTLASLELSDITLAPSFAAGTREYTASVTHNVATTRYAALPNDANAAAPVLSTSGLATFMGNEVTLAVGANNIIDLTVVAEDGETQDDYTVTVTRAALVASADARLTGLQLSGVTLELPFAPDTRAYTAQVTNDVTSTTLSATPAQSAARWSVSATEPATASGNTVTLGVGENLITVTVTAMDGATTSAYTVAVTRAQDTTPKAFLFLPALEVAPNTSVVSATITVSGLSSNVSVPVSASDGLVSLRDEAPVASGTVRNGNTVAAVASVGACGADAVTVTVNIGGLTNEFTATPRACSTDTSLAELTLSDIHFGTFTPSTRNYATTVDSSIMRTVVTATPNDGNARAPFITTNGVATVNGADVTLNVGVNEIVISVTAEDGITPGVYTVTVTRSPMTPNADATLSTLALSGATLVPDFVSGTRAYTVTVADGVTQTTVRAMPTVAGASVEVIALAHATVSGSDVTLGAGGSGATLATLRISVTAADGVTMNVYTVTVLRAPDITPDAFVFTDIPNAEPDGAVSSNAIAVSGLTAGAMTDVMASGGLVSIRGEPPAASGSVLNGNTVAAVASVGACGTEAVTVSVTIGGIEGAFTATPRACRSDTTLSGLELSDVDFGTFSPGTRMYTASVTHSVARTLVTATPNDGNAGTPVVSTRDMATVSGLEVTLGVGVNTIDITVTAEDAMTTANYVVKITREENTPPTADAGAATRSVEIGREILLSGADSADAETAAAQLRYGWSLVAGDAAHVTLGTPDASTTSFAASALGGYSVALVVTDDSVPPLSSAPVTVAITVTPIINTPPVADAGEDLTVPFGESVVIRGSGEDAESSTLSYRWDITSDNAADAMLERGEDTTRVVFTSEAAGAYTVTLTVTDMASHATNSEVMTQDSIIVTVAPVVNEPPQAVVSEMLEVEAGQTLALDGSASSDAETGSEQLSYYWELSSANVADSELSDETTARATFLSETPGMYDATFSVTDMATHPSNVEQTATASVRITVVDAVNHPPRARAGPDRFVTPGEKITLHGERTTDRETGTAALVFEWAVTSGNAATATLTGETGATPSFVSGTLGVYVVTLSVTDMATHATNQAQTSMDTMKVTVGHLQEEDLLAAGTVSVGAMDRSFAQLATGLIARRFSSIGRNAVAHAPNTGRKLLALAVDVLRARADARSPSHSVEGAGYWMAASHAEISGTPTDAGERTEYDGASQTVQAGLDRRFLNNRLLLGLALGWSTSEVKFTQTLRAEDAAPVTGEMERTSTSVHPYLALRPWANTKAWLLGGFGFGDYTFRVQNDDGSLDAATSDAEQRMLAGGVETALASSPKVEWVMRAGGLWSRSEVEAATFASDRTLPAFESTSWQAQSELEVARVSNTSVRTLRGYLTGVIRASGGDGFETGGALDLGLGVSGAYREAGLHFDFGGRFQAADTNDLTTHVVYGALRYDAGDDRRGVALSFEHGMSHVLRSRWRTGEFTDFARAGAGALGFSPVARAELGYGWGAQVLGRAGVLTAFTEARNARGAWEHAMGLRFEDPPLFVVLGGRVRGAEERIEVNLQTSF